MKTIFSLLVLAFAAVSMAQTPCEDAKKGSKESVCCQEEKAKPVADAKASKQAEDCCESTDEKPIAKGEKGCCNEKGQPAKFKVFVANKGYKFFGCEGSAGKARDEFIAKGVKVGSIQKVTSKVLI